MLRKVAPKLYLTASPPLPLAEILLKNHPHLDITLTTRNQTPAIRTREGTTEDLNSEAFYTSRSPTHPRHVHRQRPRAWCVSQMPKMCPGVVPPGEDSRHHPFVFSICLQLRRMRYRQPRKLSTHCCLLAAACPGRTRPPGHFSTRVGTPQLLKKNWARIRGEGQRTPDPSRTPSAACLHP